MKESRGYTVCSASPYLHLYINPYLPFPRFQSGDGGENS
jgi:hypothetical protein